MYHRVQVTLSNRRVREVFAPVYVNTATRREAKAVAMELLREEIVPVIESFGPCRMSLTCVTMKEGGQNGD